MRKTESVWIPFFQVKFGIQLPGIPIMIIHLFFRRFQITEILYLDGVLRRGERQIFLFQNLSKELNHLRIFLSFNQGFKIVVQLSL